MKAAAFELVSARTTDEARRHLQVDNAKVLAGGQSLGPMLNLRLVRPSLLVDVTKIPELRATEKNSNGVVLGSCITHAEIEDGVVPDASRGVLPHVAKYIAYRSVRNRGTIGGSLTHADPAGDWPNVFLALGARVRFISADGVAEIDLESFIVGAFTTVLDSDGIVTGISLPQASQNAKWGYWKLCRKLGDYAEAMCAVFIDRDRDVYRTVIGATDGKPILLTGEHHLRDPAALESSVRAASGGLESVKLQQRIGVAIRALNCARSL